MLQNTTNFLFFLVELVGFDPATKESAHCSTSTKIICLDIFAVFADFYDIFHAIQTMTRLCFFSV